MEKIKICIVGLGYVGLPLALKFAEHFDVIGFDISDYKISELNAGKDPTLEVGDDAIKSTSMIFTEDSTKIKEADFVIVAVPTPINSDNIPNTSYVLSASRTVGKNLKKGAIVVFESTVYPGLTQEECLPIIEKESGMKLGEFGLGYSPERINPGDKVHTVENIIKVVSGHNKETLDKVANLYETIIVAGVHKAPTIKVAEAAKVIENIQRDLNIALMNELALIFDKMNINTRDVIEAAGTKWNFHKYYPGLVGGHCIGVDPYYLTFKAQQLGYKPEVILSGRKINDSMHNHVVNLVKRKLKGKGLSDTKILILGLTFKPNVPDFRNSRTTQLIKVLNDQGAIVYGYDPYLKNEWDKKGFACEFVDSVEGDYDVVIIASPHNKFEENNDYEKINKEAVVVDIGKEL